jgi:hypothetical protein
MIKQQAGYLIEIHYSRAKDHVASVNAWLPFSHSDLSLHPWRRVEGFRMM